MKLHVLSRPPLTGGGQGLVVMVHGAMDRATSFRRLWAKLPDWEVVAYDRRGYAGSMGVPPSTDFADQVDDLLEVLDGRRAIVVGHSFGDVVLAAAANHPELIEAAVAFEPPAPWRGDWRSHGARPSNTEPGEPAEPADQAEQFMKRMIGEHIWERLPAATRRQRRAEGATLVAELQGLRRQAPFDPADITVAVVVGVGERGLPAAAPWARELCRLLPHGVLVEVPGAHHGVHLENPVALAGLVRTAAAMRTGHAEA